MNSIDPDLELRAEQYCNEGAKLLDDGNYHLAQDCAKKGISLYEDQPEFNGDPDQKLLIYQQLLRLHSKATKLANSFKQ